MAANVQVILARDVPNLGAVGDLVSVRPGYARNYLVPQGLALPASQKRVAQFEHQKRLVEHKRRVLRAESEKKAAELNKVEITLLVKVGEQGKLFGSITSRDISDELNKLGFNLNHRDIKLDAAIKQVGNHEVALRLEGDVHAQVIVRVAPEVDAAEVAAVATEA